MFNEILIALAVVAVTGFIAAVVLTLASHFMHVPEDEKKIALRGCLPGANCGACGYAGCDEYAGALSKGEAKSNLCVPGAGETAEKIADILGVCAEAAERRVAFVACNGTCDAVADKFEYDGIGSCSAANMIYGGPLACKFGCLGCGDCAALCPSDAICVADGVARVDTRICTGCGICASACPKHIISIIPAKSKYTVMCSNKEKGAVARKNCSNACIGCKKCMNNCPSHAITVEDNIAKIDQSKCTECGACAENCPVKCINLHIA